MSHAAAVLWVAAAVGLCPAILQAQGGQPAAPRAGGAQRIAVCSLLPRDQVKRHLPWPAVLDQMPIEEEPVGASGSSCNYPSVHIQVLPFTSRPIQVLRQKGGLETVAGLGDEAYFYNNRDDHAEVYVRVGKHLLTVQANADGTVDAVRPGALGLAKALVAKLR